MSDWIEPFISHVYFLPFIFCCRWFHHILHKWEFVKSWARLPFIITISPQTRLMSKVPSVFRKWKHFQASLVGNICMHTISLLRWWRELSPEYEPLWALISCMVAEGTATTAASLLEAKMQSNHPRSFSYYITHLDAKQRRARSNEN